MTILKITPKMKQDCPRCSGSGKIGDASIIGAAYRAARLSRGVRLGECAKYMGISSPYLFQLESGNRPWSDELIELVEKMLSTKKKIKASKKSVDKQIKREKR